ncbi:MAG: alpha/beta fold hydrolase [Gemmatimonadetes bacterium]|nr:alpha/beta fold hydrolase [Gemmatimonadota bacterium]NIQ56913.1 alpha/beta fold hydrolase [Gemmatimonadota bacterium]NIU77087.1 alpha/beta fold hydrolase [Gammaproteobacteria bacterium]NIX46419.1 alpha/beta fold hydrolase [Gemmatimonadota bacterium]NIY10731.1 alpha/beta fold hydrolase [Gemmatimonadota bacterium]
MRQHINVGMAGGRRLGGAAILATLAAVTPPSLGWAQDAAPPMVAALGTCRFTSGAEVRDCRVAYRAYGRLSPARDNVVLVPTFFAGRSEDHAFMLGTYVDTTRYHVVIVDALADGHSSSPSNTDPLSRGAFDALTIGDMVASQRALLRELGIARVRAVVGISMGGFQAFEWAVRHPELADVVVAVVGTPRAGAGDRLIYATAVGAAEQARAVGLQGVEAWRQASRIENLFMGTPGAMEEKGSEGVEADVMSLAASYARAGWALEDYAAQARALASHDVSAAFGGSMERAARAVTARMLVVFTPDDRMVSPGPAAEFARMVGAEILAVPSPCGHAVFWCEDEAVGSVVRDFIDREGEVAAARSR